MVKNLRISIFILTFVAEIVGGHVPMKGGFSTSPFSINKVGVIKKVDTMSKKKTLAEVKAAFKEVWGDDYDYSLITEENYVDTHHVVQVICKRCGAVFTPTPNNHQRGTGCPKCAVNGLKKDVYGIGVNDSDYQVWTTKDGKRVGENAYTRWIAMMSRCYGRVKETNSAYIGCKVCKEWLLYSNFEKWFNDPINGYRDGYHLDKDILVRGNKLYSPDTCCFVPQEINNLLNKHAKRRGFLPIGVTQKDNLFVARLNMIDKRKTLGTFKTPEEAFYAYKDAKEKHIQEVATQYFNEDKITEKVYNALMNYRVEITD